jgi:hypothetical protein
VQFLIGELHFLSRLILIDENIANFLLRDGDVVVVLVRLEIILHLVIGGLNLLGDFRWRNHHVRQIEGSIFLFEVRLEIFLGHADAGGNKCFQFFPRDVFGHSALERSHVTDPLLVLRHVELAGSIDQR